MPRWLGPFKVIKQCGPVAYELELPASMSRLHPVFHVCLLQKNVPLQGGRRKRSPPPVVLDSGELEWEVEAIYCTTVRASTGARDGVRPFMTILLSGRAMPWRKHPGNLLRT